MTTTHLKKHVMRFDPDTTVKERRDAVNRHLRESGREYLHMSFHAPGNVSMCYTHSDLQLMIANSITFYYR